MVGIVGDDDKDGDDNKEEKNVNKEDSKDKDNNAEDKNGHDNR